MAKKEPENNAQVSRSLAAEAARPLRQRAEELLRTRRTDISEMTGEDIQALVHQLEVRQIELELQNQELREAQHAQRRLQESQERYHRLTEAVTDYIYHVRVERGRAVETIHGANCEAVTGYTPEQFAAEPMLWITMVLPEDRAAVERQAACILSGQPQGARGPKQGWAAPGIEHRIRRKDGQIRWVLSTTSPQYDDQGRLIAYDGLLRDITDRKRAEAALQQLNEELEQRVDARTADLRRRTNQLAQQSAELERRERGFSTLAANVPGLFSYVDRDQRYRYVNRGYEETFRQPANKIVGKLVAEVLGPQQFEIAQPHIEAALRGEEVMFEGEFDFPDGEHVMHVRYVPDCDEQGLVEGFFALATDITAWKRTEQSLIQSEERLHLALQGAGGGVWDWDLLREEAWWSPEMYDLWGQPKGAIGEPPVTPMKLDHSLAIVHDEDREPLLKTFEESIAGGGEFQREFRIQHPHRGERWMASFGRLVYDDSGRAVRMHGITLDITERKQAEMGMREREQRLRAILDTAADAIINIDRRGIITNVNPATERMFGYTQDELIGQNIKVLMPPPYCDEHDGYLARYLETGEAKIIGVGREVVARHKDRSTFPVDLAVSEVKQLGLFTGIIRDITERVQAQQKLLQSERLAALGEAMAGLAHESRNALQRSQACLDLLAEQFDEKPELQELLETIQRAQDDLYRLYEEVRAYAAPVKIKPQYRHVGEVVRKAWDELAAVRKGREARFNEDVVCDDLHCMIDPFAIGRVFHNILENAVQACGDPVEIEAVYTDSNLAASAPSHQPGAPAGPFEYLSVAIRDNGPGLSPEQAERVFHSFFTTKTHGTGLGMAIAQRIVQAHGGQITVRPNSPPGRLGCKRPGAEFIVTLPRKQP